MAKNLIEGGISRRGGVLKKWGGDFEEKVQTE